MVHGHLKALMRPKLNLAETALAQIQALGFAASDVHNIVLTHLDFDHAAAPADFPDATVHPHAPALSAPPTPHTLTDNHRQEARLRAPRPNAQTPNPPR